MAHSYLAQCPLFRVAAGIEERWLFLSTVPCWLRVLGAAFTLWNRGLSRELEDEGEKAEP